MHEETCGCKQIYKYKSNQEINLMIIKMHIKKQKKKKETEK